MDFEAIASQALSDGAGLGSQRQAWRVACSDDDFDSTKLKLREAEVGECLNRCESGASALPGLTDPVAEIAEAVDYVELIEATPANELTRGGIEDAEFMASAALSLLITVLEPRLSVGG